jgi:hypothetical protein
VTSVPTGWRDAPDRAPRLWDARSEARNPYRGVRELGLIVDLIRAGRGPAEGPVIGCLRAATDPQSVSYDPRSADLIRTRAPIGLPEP